MDELRNTLLLVSMYIKGVWIKKRYIIVASWLICPIGLIVVSMMPDQYQSSAKVFADTRSLLKPLLRGLAVQTDPASEIQVIAKTLLSRPNLEDIAREADLDLAATTPQQYEGLINGLARNIRLKGTARQNIYTISYNSGDPKIAQRVVNVTLTKFVETTLGQSRQDSDSATEFLETQIAEYETRLSGSERRLAEFKREYSGMLPGSNGGYYGKVSSLSGQLDALKLNILEKSTMLAKAKEKLKEVSSPKEGESNTQIVTQYDERIRALTSKLDDLLIRFTDVHPEVVETKRRLTHLQGVRKSEIKYIIANVEEGGNAASDRLSQNVIYQQLSIQINELEGEVASLRIRRDKYQQELKELNDKIDLLPEVEAKLTALNRDYSIVKGKYEELVDRKDSADLSRKAEESAEEVQFRIIEPPRLPLKPSGPKRILFYTMVLVASFGVGIALAFLVSQISPVVSNAAQLTMATGRPVFGFVSDTNIDEIKRKNRMRLFLFIFSSACIVGMYLIFVLSESLYGESPITKIRPYLDSLMPLVEKLL